MRIGLGDITEGFLKLIGVKTIIFYFSKKFGFDCGCDERKKKMNEINLNLSTLKERKKILERELKKLYEDRPLD